MLKRNLRLVALAYNLRTKKGDCQGSEASLGYKVRDFLNPIYYVYFITERF